MAADPRDHHHKMKYLLAQLAIGNPDRFFATFGPSGDAAYLTDFWTAIGLDMPEDQRVPAEGLSAWHRPAEIAGDPETLIFTLPKPVERNEAYFVAAVRRPGEEVRVFFLEKAVMPSTGAESTVLAELSADARSNWGIGTEPVLSEFAEFLTRLVNDATATPLSVISFPKG